jgi:hypothetical protein
MNTELDARIRALVVEVVETSPPPPPFEALGQLADAQAVRVRGARVRRARTRVLIAAGVCVALVVATGVLLSLGGDDGSRVVTPGSAPSRGTLARYGTNGVSVALPRTWYASLARTTSLVDPAEAFAVGTFFPLRSSMSSCPVNALADLGPRDAFVIAYVWAARPSRDLPTRPARFGPKVHWEKHDLCSRLVPNGTTRYLVFRESGRQVMLGVVFGEDVSSARAAQAYRVLNSLVVEPLRTP